MKPSVTIVLVETSHPGNIGATMRAMETMDILQLHLINPKHYPHPDIEAMASNALRNLGNVKVSTNFDEAIRDAEVVFVTSARDRNISLPQMSARECGTYCADNPGKKIAIIFGPERTGLTNEHMLKGNFHVFIPTSKDYQSLNLAMAVQIICYEINMALLRQSNQNKDNKNMESLATFSEVEKMHQHMEEALIKLDFFHNDDPKKLLLKLRRLFNRSSLSKPEVNILRGIFNSIERHIG